ncbi:exported hypothetical protein [uncultured Eubacteriales bacterium]|uniref:Uncharacterized protein n=1 Tax=uncultured Eubacteriales bacterium TaxID=172733 RepID=A0A212J614_9FIRM|nr:exported hypothetical protein [uncultured Eubacteriales bacterium]
MIFLTWFSRMREPSWYIFTRCTLIACAMLCSALVVLVWAGNYSVSSSLLHSYAGHTAAMALAVFSAGGIGSALMEDILAKR